MRPPLVVLKNVVDAALSRPIAWATFGPGETIGDPRFGDQARYLAPIVPPLRALLPDEEKTG